MIEAPTNCPSCDEELVWVNDVLYCRSPSCPAQSAKQVEHFAKSLKIKGLGPSTIEKLGIENIREIYELDEDYTARVLASDKLADKLLTEIERSKQEPLNTVLPGFGIALIGRTATEKLSHVVSNIFEIDDAACKAAGLGPAATANIMKWLDNRFEEYSDLPFTFDFAENTKAIEATETICISGKLKSYSTKAEATEVLESRGFRVKDSLTKEVTILVNESGIESAKTKKAEQLGISIINNLKEYLEN